MLFSKKVRNIVLIVIFFCSVIAGTLYMFRSTLYRYYISWQANKVFPVEKVREDIDFMVKKIEDIHPDPYTNITKEAFNDIIQETKRNIKRPLRKIEIYRLLSPVLAKIKDAHTNASFPTDEIKNIVFSKKKIFCPFELLINDNGVFVKNYRTQYGLKNRDKMPDGAQIITLNGENIENVVQKLHTYKSSENNIFPQAYIERYFPLLYAIILGKKQTEFNVKYTYNGKSERKTLPGISFMDGLYIRTEGKNKNLFEYKEFPALKTALLQIRGCRKLKKLEDFLQKSFAKIERKSIENIIFDFRENNGGTTLAGKMIFKYISEKKIKQFSDSKVSQFKEDNSIKQVKRNKVNLNKTIKLFEGKIYLLQGGYTFSSGSDFTGAFKHYKVGEIIGTETGGLNSSFGDSITVVLPNTKLKLRVSHKYFIGANGETTRQGIIPDYEVEQTVEDLKQGKDTVLEFTKDLIWQRIKEKNYEE